jgi:hypothetical protein
MKNFTILFIVFISITFCNIVGGGTLREIYVSTLGDDQNDGSTRLLSIETIPRMIGLINLATAAEV